MAGNNTALKNTSTPMRHRIYVPTRTRTNAAVQRLHNAAPNQYAHTDGLTQ